MVFIQSSEASQANSQQLAIAQTTIEALAELLKLLLSKKEDEQQKGDGGKQEAEAKPDGFSDNDLISYFVSVRLNLFISF